MMASVISGPQDSSREQLQSKGQHLPYQIFPDAEEDTEVLQSPTGPRGRLPSIVVDPTQVSEGESGGLLWPLQRHASIEENDSFQDQEQSNQTEQDNAEGNLEEREAHIKYSSATVQPGPVDHSRLTPPQSPTAPETAPPCFRG